MSEDTIPTIEEAVEPLGGDTKYERLYARVKADKLETRALQGRIAVLESTADEREQAFDEEIDLLKQCHARTIATADKALEEAFAEIEKRRSDSHNELLVAHADYIKLNKRVDKKAEELREAFNRWVREQ